MDLRVVSARPSPEDEARAPHRLYGYRDGANACSAADWADEARREIAAAQGSGRLPVLVGGTGLYLRTLIDGIAPVPDIPSGIRIVVRALSVGDAHEALAREDPEAAARIRPSDTTRIARALEVVRATGRTLKSWQAEKIGGIGDAIELRPLLLLPPRDWLHERCDARFGAIFSGDGIGEVRALLERNLPPRAPVMQAIGVPEIAAFLRGDMHKEAALAAGRAATRQYAKRQYTWFRHQPPAAWPRFEGTPDSSTVRAELVEALSFT